MAGKAAAEKEAAQLKASLGEAQAQCKQLSEQVEALQREKAELMLRLQVRPGPWAEPFPSAVWVVL
jgi:hypothetical protein